MAGASVGVAAGGVPVGAAGTGAIAVVAAGAGAATGTHAVISQIIRMIAEAKDRDFVIIFISFLHSRHNPAFPTGNRLHE